MSFDLGFWWEKQEISPSEAARKYSAMCEGSAGFVDAHPALATFYEELVSAFPDLTEENMEVSPWAASLHCTDECVIVSMSYPRQSEVSGFLLGLAKRHGILTYDPQSDSVHFPGAEDGVALELASGSVYRNPGRDAVVEALQSLSSEDWYVILETAPGWFIQVGFGSTAQVSEGFYALEFREGIKDRHFRAVTSDLN